MNVGERKGREMCVCVCVCVREEEEIVDEGQRKIME